MNKQKHIINRQVLELTIPERGRAHSIQSKTSEIVKQKLHPALDSLFSKLVPADEIIRIDRMVIDLGTITENELESALVERAVKEIGENINKLKFSGKISTEIKSVNGHSSDKIERFIATSKSDDLLDQFIYFLQFGRFPWWHKSSDNSAKSDSYSLEKIFTEVLKYDITILISSILPLFKNPAVIQRLVFQFSHSQLDALLKRLNDELFRSYALFKGLLFSAKTAQDRKNLAISFYKIALQYFSTEQELITENLKIGFVKDILKVYLANYSVDERETLLTEILHSLQVQQNNETRKEANLVMVAVIQVALDMSSRNQHLQEIIQNIVAENGELINYLVKRHIKRINNQSGKKRIEEKLGKGSEKEFDSELEEFSTKSFGGTKIEKSEKSFSLFPPKPSKDAEGIIVSNAGLVLIHPFLKYFFEGLNLLNEELRFKSQSDIFKAIHLLQFIATGQEISTEIELPLNKILCGLDVNDPVPKDYPLSEEEKEECINLIKTALERWNALKTTNPAALRETYLQREGILKQSGQSWNLYIERNSFDVMLEKLPWSINLIKLPWLSQILYVEW